MSQTDYYDHVSKATVQITGPDAARGTFGTGFVFHREGGKSYVLTCAHVLDNLGDGVTPHVDEELAEVVVRGSVKSRDLAVLVVSGLDEVPLLPLLPSKGKVSIHTEVRIFGWQDSGVRELSPISAMLFEQAFLSVPKGRIQTWKLRVIRDKDIIARGFSGAAVLDISSGYVVAVVSHSQGTDQGRAIAISELEKLWENAPSTLFSYPALFNATSSLGVDIKDNESSPSGLYSSGIRKEAYPFSHLKHSDGVMNLAGGQTGDVTVGFMARVEGNMTVNPTPKDLLISDWGEFSDDAIIPVACPLDRFANCNRALTTFYSTIQKGLGGAISIVGQTKTGKSLLLSRLAAAARELSITYAFVSLKHINSPSMKLFIRCLAASKPSGGDFEFIDPFPNYNNTKHISNVDNEVLAGIFLNDILNYSLRKQFVIFIDEWDEYRNTRFGEWLVKDFFEKFISRLDKLKLILIVAGETTPEQIHWRDLRCSLIDFSSDEDIKVLLKNYDVQPNTDIIHELRELLETPGADFDSVAEMLSSPQSLR